MRLCRLLLPMALPLLWGACAVSGPRPVMPPAAPPEAAYQVAIFGDMPYKAPGNPQFPAEQAAYRALLDTLNTRDFAFVVHVGDFTSGDCSDSLFAQRLREFQAVNPPLVYTPGDNEWTDCPRDRYDPLERLNRLRTLFFAGDTSLGRHPLPLTRQSDQPAYAAFPENARWQQGSVLFLTLHVVGSNNNRGDGAVPGEEYTTRNAANLAWLREAFAVAGQQKLHGVVVVMQANPRLEGWMARLEPTPTDGFADLRQELERLARAFGRPVLLIHGDTHYFRVDKPFADPQTRESFISLTRVETFGTPNIHGVVLTVDPADPNLFHFEPLVVPTASRR